MLILAVFLVLSIEIFIVKTILTKALIFLIPKLGWRWPVGLQKSWSVYVP